MRTATTTVRRLLIFSAVAALALGLLAAPGAAQDPGDDAVEITLLHDTHLHGTYGDDEESLACPPDEVGDSSFGDVAGNTHEASIACAEHHGITSGVSTDPPRFAPLQPVSRGQMATFVAAALDAAGMELPEPDDGPFTDVPGTTHEGSINRLFEAGIVSGQTETSFRPSAPVTRGQAATMLVGAVEVVTDTEAAPLAGPHFRDAGGVHVTNVDVAYELGLLSGHTDGTFRGNADIQRGQMATVVTGTLDHLLVLDAPRENLGRYMMLGQLLKDRAEHALFVANGDDIAPSLHSGVFRGDHMIDALNVSPIDVDTFGNHEFDYGPDLLRGLITDSDFPWVTANVLDIASGEPFADDLGVERFRTFEFDGVTVGVTGLGPENMASITSLGDDTEQVPAEDVMPDVVAEMRDAGVDVVVVSSHLANQDARDLAAAVDGIDVIVGDHNAQTLDEPEIINDTIVSFVGDEYDSLGELTLHVDDGEVTYDFTRWDLADHQVRPHPDVQAVVDDYNAELEAELDVQIGERDVTWDTRLGVVRQEEEAFGNFLTDVLREEMDTDVAVQNSGGIRADREFPPGEITRRDIMEILPFDNYAVSAELSGATLLEALEHSVSGWGDGHGRFLQVSGIEFSFDPSADPNDRVVDVEINGEPLDESETYTMATNDFTLGGGDDYTMFADDAVLIEQTDFLLSTLVIEYIQDLDAPVTTDVDPDDPRIEPLE